MIKSTWDISECDNEEVLASEENKTIIGLNIEKPVILSKKFR